MLLGILTVDISTFKKTVGLGDIGTKKNSNRQFDVRTEGDLVSGLGFTQNANKETIGNNHLIKNELTAHESDNL